jgi:dipeptidyl aminopeptidase/acylaminoacyl peptidase
LDDLDQLVQAVTVLSTELDELACLQHDDAALGSPRNRDASTAPEVEKSFLSKDLQRAQHGVLVHPEDGGEIHGRRKTFTRLRWSPDGRTIAFVRRATLDGFDYDIYAVDSEGGPARSLTRSPAYENDPAWSPDGRRIAFVRGNDIWLMNADGSGQRRLTTGAAHDRAPNWSPDGRTIAFDQRVGSVHEIHVMNADGSGRRRLALGGYGRDGLWGHGGNAGPLWSPDGTKIA